MGSYSLGTEDELYFTLPWLVQPAHLSMEPKSIGRFISVPWFIFQFIIANSRHHSDVFIPRSSSQHL